jgi:hypothetical protein
MPLFDPTAILNNADLVGPQKLFGSQPALDDAVAKRGFPQGRLVGGLRKRTGEEVNEWWDSRPVEKLNRQAATDGRQRKRRQSDPHPLEAAE